MANGERLLALADRLRQTNLYKPDEIYRGLAQLLLYDEHTWGADCSVTKPESEFTKAQWKIKAQFAVDADRAGRRSRSAVAGPWPAWSARRGRR